MLVRNSRIRSARAGFTVVEVTLAAGVLVIGVLGMAASMASSLKLVEVNRETVQAHEAARQTIEAMQATTFEDIVASYNSDTADDPNGPGTAPGSQFAIPGLNAPGASVGLIRLPIPEGADYLSEALVDPDLGMPRDLNGDGVITPGPMPGNYLVLPVRVETAWQGVGGVRRLGLNSLLIRR